jgi:DNA-binding HxlR family transcriptional regulator
VKWEEIGRIPCSVARTLSVIGDRWTLLVLRDAFLGVRRFEQFQRDLGTTRHILSDRLAKLVEHGILERVRYQAKPERYEYRLTGKGLELHPVLLALVGWGDRWMAGDAGPPVVYVHRDCGRQISPAFTCPDCGAAITPRNLTARRNVSSSSGCGTGPKHG